MGFVPVGLEVETVDHVLRFARREAVVIVGLVLGICVVVPMLANMSMPSHGSGTSGLTGW